MIQKLVGLTCNVLSAADGHGPRLTCNTAYQNALLQAGCLPVILPLTACSSALQKIVEKLDGILLTGGADIQPSIYHEAPHPKLGETEPERDAMEMDLIPLALQKDLPVFAICRGMQSLNAALGGTLHQHLEPGSIDHRPGKGRNYLAHSIAITPGSRLHSIAAAPQMQVNSLHHQAVSKVAPALQIAAVAPDGIVEAVEMPGRKYVLAVQFHPEELYREQSVMLKLFEAFVQAL